MNRDYNVLVTKKFGVTLTIEDASMTDMKLENIFGEMVNAISNDWSVEDIGQIVVTYPDENGVCESEIDLKISYEAHCTDTDATWGYYGGNPPEHEESICIEASDIQYDMNKYLKERYPKITASISEALESRSEW